MQRIIIFNSKEVIEGVKNYCIDEGQYLWIDIIDPMLSELDSIKKQFDVDPDILNAIYSASKKHQPAISILNNCYFTIFLNINYNDRNELIARDLYPSWTILVNYNPFIRNKFNTFFTSRP